MNHLHQWTWPFLGSHRVWHLKFPFPHASSGNSPGKVSWYNQAHGREILKKIEENWRIIPQIFLTILSSSSHLRWFRKVTGYPWVPPWQPMRNPRSRDPSCKAWLQWVMWQVQLQASPSRPSRGPPCANRLPCRHRWASTEDCTRLDVTPHPGQKIAGPSLRMASPRIGTGWSSLLVFLAERMPSLPCFWHLQKINQKVFWYPPHFRKPPFVDEIIRMVLQVPKNLPSGYVKIAIENGHRNSWFSH